MNEELLKNKGINKKLWEYCYIIDGEVFPPKAKLTVVDEEFEYEIIMTGEECYNEWLEEQEPKPPKEDETANKISVLEEEIAELKQENKLLQHENKLLHAQVEVLSDTTDFHEELIAEMAMKVYA